MDKAHEQAVQDRFAEKRVQRDTYAESHPVLHDPNLHPLMDAIMAAHAQVPVAIAKALAGERRAA
jgi:hypothetical protein